jgi:GTPase SAR1 family protein
MQSFQNLAHWCNEVRTQSEEDAVVILVGNQADRESEREVSTEQGQRFQKENNIQFFIETSAKTSLNVQETFIMAAKMLYRKNLAKIKKSKESLLAKRRGDKLRRENSAAQKKQGGCGC